ncbi:MAG: hypothetical protein H5T65_04690 [Chloroflexi bacterium]|nr:hypothetical protein [Chloroflexota bacterium]
MQINNMRAQGIPPEVRQKVEAIIKKFNETVIKDPDCYYVARYRGRYVYLDRFDHGVKGPICRLEYTGRMDDWDFAIYLYSDERYDPDEWFFPGSDYVDGTVEGALKAGLEAYP